MSVRADIKLKWRINMTNEDKVLFLELLLKHKIQICYKITDAEIELDGLIDYEKGGEYLTFEEDRKLKDLDIEIGELKAVLTKLDSIEKFMRKQEL